MSRRCQRRRVGFAWPLGLVICCSMVCSARAKADADERLTFRAPQRVPIVVWPQRAGQALALARVVDAARPFSLIGREVALVPARPGDWLKVSSSGVGEVEIGLATGADPWPDVLTFAPASSPFVVPTWSSARHVALRSRDGAKTSVRVALATGVSDPFVWYRYDQRMTHWTQLEGNVEPPSPAPDPEAAAVVRRLAIAKRALLFAGVPARDAWPFLVASWQDESKRLRPLLLPYFTRQQLTVDGGESLTLEDEELWREVKAGEELLLRGPAATVVQLLVLSMRPGTTRLRVVEAERTAVDVTTRAGLGNDGGASPWTTPRLLRVQLPRDNPALRVVVLEGAARVRLRGYRQRSDLFDESAVRALDEELKALARRHSGALAERALSAMTAALRRADAPRRRRLLAISREPSLPALLRAVVLTQLVGQLDPEVASWTTELRRALLALQPLPQAQRYPLERALLSRLDALSVPAELAPDGFAGVRSDGLPELLELEQDDDAQAVFALRQLLAPLTLDTRPSVAPLAERHAMRTRSRSATQRARRLWSREAPFRALPAEPGVASSLHWSVPFDDRERPGQCASSAGGRPRWTLLSEPRTIEVQAEAASHALVTVRALSEGARDTRLLVDGVAVSVHGSLGLSGRVALRPGPRRFQPGQEPLLARIPRAGPLPCEELREAERFYDVEGGGVYFAVPPGRLPTMARVELGGRKLYDEPQDLVIGAGDLRLAVWVRGFAGGRIEFPVDSSTGAIRVHSDRALALRVAARLPLPKQMPPRQLGLTPERDREAIIDDMLREVRRTSRELRQAAGEARPQLLSQRARLLWGLGYSSLARIDFERSGSGSWDTGPPAGDSQASARSLGEVELPEHAGAVVPMGYLSRLDPLPSPVAQAGVEEALRLLHSKASGARIGAYVEREQSAPDPPLDLVHAVLAQRAGLREQSAHYLARFARAVGSPEALARAASYMVDMAARSQSVELTMRALSLAIEARRLAEQDQGPPSSMEFFIPRKSDPASAPLARLSPVIRWSRPIAVERSAGTALVEHEHDELRMVPLGQRVRRALLDAPEQAALLDERRVLTSVLQPGQSYHLRASCHALEGASEECRPQLLIDGRRAICQSAETPSSGRTLECQLAPSARPQRVEVRLPEGLEALGYVELRDSAGQALRTHVVSPWHQVDVARPLELQLAGPTVVRLRVRGHPEQPSTLSVELSAGDKVVRETIELPGQRDHAARRFGVETADGVGFELQRDLPLPDQERAVLRVSVDRGTALVAPEVANVNGYPEPRVRTEAVAPELVALPAALAPLSFQAQVEEQRAAELPLTLGAELGYVFEDLGEGDDETALGYTELGAYARSELVERGLWLHAGALQRLRAGDESTGMAASFSLSSPAEGWPGVFGSGRFVVQPSALGTGLGARASLGVGWSLQLAPDLSLSPQLRATVRRADDRLATLSHVDRDVYSAWSQDHPRTLSLGVRARHRMFVDAIFRYGTELRSLPTVDGVDRVDGFAAAELFAGHGYVPVLNFAARVSYRLRHALREESYSRFSLGLRADFWHWQSGDRRFILSLASGYRTDLPSVTSNGQVLSGALVFSAEQVWGRGLSDYTPAARGFRDRREEGAGLTRWRALPDHMPQEAYDE